MFAYWISYGIQDTTDGSSNTIIFAESLVGDAGGGNTGANMHRNNAILNVGSVVANAEAYDASSVSYQQVIMPAINACTQAMKANASGGVVTDDGNRWAWGAVGMTLFNTVVTPNGAPGTPVAPTAPIAVRMTRTSPLPRVTIRAVSTWRWRTAARGSSRH